MDRLLSVPELANLLGVSRMRVYELVRLKLIPCVRIGRQIRFEVETVEAWVKKGGSGLHGKLRKGEKKS